MADDDLYRAEAYGPSQGEFTRATLTGPLGNLQQGDIAVSPNMLDSYPLGSTWDVVDSEGNVLREGVRVADTSWKSPGNPNTNTFELWNDKDLGHARLVASGSGRTPYDPSKAISETTSQDYLPPPEDQPHDILAPEAIQSRIQEQYPGYKSDGETVYKAFTKKYVTPIEQLRALYPEYKEAPDPVFTEAIRKKYYPTESPDDFRDRMNPPTGVTGATQNFLKELWPNMVRSFDQSTAQIASYPQRIADADQWLAQNGGWIGKALEGNLTGQNPDPDNEFRDKIASLNQFAEQQKKAAADVKVPQAQGISGNVGSVVGQAIGSTPSALMSFIPGAGPATSLVWGMTYEGLSAAADAKESKTPNADLQGFMASGTRGLQQWILNTPRGRLVSGLWNAALGMGDDQVRNWLSGNKDNDIDKTAATGAVDFMIGALMGRGREKLPKAAQESLDKAVAARDSGDIQKAKELTDQTMLFLPDQEKAQTGQLLLKWRDDVIPMKDSETKALPDKTPPPDKAHEAVTDQFYFGGLPVTGKVIGDFLIDVMPKVRAGAEWAAEKTGAKQFGESWQKFWEPERISERTARAGAIIAKENAESATNLNRLQNLMFTRAGLEDRTLAERATQELTDADLSDRQLRFSLYSDRRDAFFNIRPDATLKKWAVDHEMGRSTGNDIADQLEKRYDEILAKYGQRAAQAGLHFDLVDTYIPHIIKNKADIAKVTEHLRQRWGDPSFINHRQVPTIAELHALGIELKTYNPERYTMMYASMVEQAVAKIQALNNFVRSGDAVPEKDLKSYPKDFQALVTDPQASTRVRSPAGDWYWVANESDFMMHRAWDRNKLYDTWMGTPVQLANIIKQKTVGLRLGASGFHPVHMLDIAMANDLATTTQAFLASKGTGADLLRALTEAVKSPRSIKPPTGYEQLLDFYNGAKGVGLNELTPENRQRRLYQLKGGLAPLVSHERQEQFLTHLSKVAPTWKRVSDKALDLGYKILTVSPVQEAMFKRWIPSMKMYAYDNAVSGLFDRRPELLRPENEWAQRVELRKIARDVDTRFGEMFYDNLFWPKEMKSIGQALFISLGWRLSEWRLYAGNVHHMLSNAYHADELVKQARAEGMKPVIQRALNNNLLYGFWYHALTFSKNALITALIGGGIKTGLSFVDLVYPRVGKDKQGKDKRLKPPYFYSDIYSLNKKIQDAGGYPFGVPLGVLNDYKYKLQGDLVELYDILVTNKDYRNTQIHSSQAKDPIANFAEQSAQSVAHFAIQSLPISEENLFFPKPGGDWRDQLFPFLGLPSAPSWASETDLDNRIFNRYLKSQPQEKARVAQDVSDAWQSYRAAILNKDGHAMLEARKELSNLHISEKSLDNFAKSAQDPEKSKMSAGKSVFHRLNPLEQEQMLKGMTPDERKEYLQYASPQVRKWFKQ